MGALSYDVEIQTFHAYALKLIARVSNKDDRKILDNAIEEATRQITQGEIKLPHTTVLILDEFQDINEKSFEFVKAIYKANNEDMRIIAVGDDDQCNHRRNGGSGHGQAGLHGPFYLLVHIAFSLQDPHGEENIGINRIAYQHEKSGHRS